MISLFIMVLVYHSDIQELLNIAQISFSALYMHISQKTQASDKLDYLLIPKHISHLISKPLLY
jgi:hypothetical protein